MSTWDEESLEAALDSKGWLVSRREIDYAVQFELTNSVKVNLYQTGRLTVGGPKSSFKSEVQGFVDDDTHAVTSPAPVTGTATAAGGESATVTRRVFVVHGHDVDAPNELELILRRVNVKPIILQNIPSAGETIIEKLESLTDADFACVLLTPDDIGAAANQADSLRPRARQNVVLELGMVLSRLGRHRVAILVKGTDLENPSDIDGLIYIPFRSNVGEAANAIGATLASAGFKIDIRDILGS